MSKKYKLLCKNGFYFSNTKGTLGGNSALKIYGRLDCPSALRWLVKGYYKPIRVFFKDENDAIETGYRPCGVFMREKYLLWKENERFKDSKV
jgi:hypothetical protein